MRQIFLDTETTGLSAAQGDRIIEIGCVELVNRKLTGNNWHEYLNPGRDSHVDALAVHGIQNAFLLDKPKFGEIADSLLNYLQGAEVVIHNAPFDLSFLNAELALLKRPKLEMILSGVVDTLVMAKNIYPGKRNNLDALCDRLDVDNSGRTLHGALLDAELLADVYINLTRGQESLMMDQSEDQGPAVALQGVDFNALGLATLFADEGEVAAHEAVLTTLDKTSKGRTVWRYGKPTAILVA